jgi:uncharacterized protein YjbI with pentapeptide repeats
VLWRNAARQLASYGPDCAAPALPLSCASAHSQEPEVMSFLDLFRRKCATCGKRIESRPVLGITRKRGGTCADCAAEVRQRKRAARETAAQEAAAREAAARESAAREEAAAAERKRLALETAPSRLGQLPQDLRRANLRAVDLSWLDLQGRDLCYADLRSANLQEANLTKANLGAAKLSGANLCGADLSDANLQDADLSGCKYDEAKFDYAAVNFETKYPSGFVPITRGVWVTGMLGTGRWDHWDDSRDTPLASIHRLVGWSSEREAIPEIEWSIAINPNVVHEPTDSGATPLFYAVCLGKKKIAALLVQHGANPNAVTANGNSALKAAMERGDAEMIAVLNSARSG